jgi:hypothetical protein
MSVDAPCNPFVLVIVGAGPSCTYVLERLAATAANLRNGGLELHVFDKSGNFGAGQVHSTGQPVTSYLNRIAGQVAFAADESVDGAGPLLPREQRPTLHEWCQGRFRLTGDQAFDLSPEDWPKRYIHGMALRESFERYVTMLRAHPGIHVTLHDGEVLDVRDRGTSLEVVHAAGGGAVVADHVLMVTGHSSNDPLRTPRLARLARFAARHPCTYVPSAYPLEQLEPDTVGPGKVVGCAGMGLTAIDVILYLTEGSGGVFEPRSDGRLRYRPSGREPARIVPFSDAGLFGFARPFNAKQRDPARLEHRGRFLTHTAVDRLRVAVGTPMDLGRIGARRQLDFERDLLPIVLLEMTYVYYRTLLGRRFGDELARRVRPAYDAFLTDRGDTASRIARAAAITAAVDGAVHEAVRVVDGAFDAGHGSPPSAPEAAPPWARSALRRYREVAKGCERLADNLFSGRASIRPIATDERVSAHSYRDALLAFMERDHCAARQGNVDNAAKAAADGVWRDLRPVLAYAVDFGGLTAESHRVFLDVYLHHHNRLANGAALAVMERIRALIEQGYVDASVGPRPTIELDDTGGRFWVRGTRTDAAIALDTIVDARVHPFDPAADVTPIYRNLMRRGLIRKWKNPSAHGADYEPGGLDLTSDFHPVRRDGEIDQRLTFLGPPSEGVMFFQLGALRPKQNHHVMQDVLCWMREFWQSVDRHTGRIRVGNTS